MLIRCHYFATLFSYDTDDYFAITLAVGHTRRRCHAYAAYCRRFIFADFATPDMLLRCHRYYAIHTLYAITVLLIRHAYDITLFFRRLRFRYYAARCADADTLLRASSRHATRLRWRCRH